jgi:hypothetical protein
MHPALAPRSLVNPTQVFRTERLVSRSVCNSFPSVYIFFCGRWVSK